MTDRDLSPQQLAEACADAMFSRDNASRGLGMRIESVAPGRAVLTMTVREEMVQGHGNCHGGFIFTLADSAFAFACNSYDEATVASGCRPRSTTSSTAAPTRPARTTATWRAWRCCWRACRWRCPAPPSTACAAPAWTPSAPPPAPSRPARWSWMIAGGVESMSRAPFVMGKADSAFSRRPEIDDTTIGWRFVNPLMKAQYGVDSMPETAENVAEQFNISREDQDAFALRSQQKAAAAQEAGRLAEEITAGRDAARKGSRCVVDPTSTRARPRSRSWPSCRPPSARAAASPPATPPGSTTAPAPCWSPRGSRRAHGLKPHGPHRRHGHRRRRAAHHGHRPGARPAARLLERTGLTLDRDGRDRAQRGLRRPGAGRDCASSASPTTTRTGQPQRRRHRPGPPAGHERRPPGDHRP
jgi:phenylacetic acid degradation protein PaaD